MPLVDFKPLSVFLSVSPTSFLAFILLSISGDNLLIKDFGDIYFVNTVASPLSLHLLFYYGVFAYFGKYISLSLFSSVTAAVRSLAGDRFF